MDNYYKQVITTPKRTLYSVPDFDFKVSLAQPAPGVVMTFFHIDVYYFQASTLREMRTAWSKFRNRLPPVVYAQGDVTDLKWEKFVKQFGFEFCTDCVCSDGVSRRIFMNKV
jgi:hypothetical protein